MAFLAAMAVLVAVLSGLAGCGGSTTTSTTSASVSTSAPVTATASATSATTGASIASTTATSQGQPNGKALFAANCAVCHGTEGGGLRGPDLRPLTDADQERIASHVTDGGTVMPAFGAKLTSEEIQSVAAYVISLQ